MVFTVYRLVEKLPFFDTFPRNKISKCKNIFWGPKPRHGLAAAKHASQHSSLIKDEREMKKIKSQSRKAKSMSPTKLKENSKKG